MSRQRYGSARRADRDRWRKRRTLEEAIESVPSHPTATPTARQPTLPDPRGRDAETVQCRRVAGDPVVREVAHEFLTQCPVLILQVTVAVEPTPFREGLQSTAESALGRLALHHPSPGARASPVVREPQQVENSRGLARSWGPSARGAIGPLERHQPRLLRVDRQAVLLEPL